MSDRSRRLLVRLSTAQLVANVAGLAVALRRRHAFHFLFLQGNPERVARESTVVGTALSAPLPMVVTQAAATAVLARRRSDAAARVLGLLGAGMLIGYPGEELVRRRLTVRGFDRVETPVAAAGLALAAAMTAVAVRSGVRTGGVG